jgi:hypothetical protein
MENIVFEKVYIDITNILNSTIALGDYRGKEVWEEIEKAMDSVSDRTLVLIDFRKVIWVDTSFCYPVFGPIFQAFENDRWLKKYIIFQMYDFHKPGFFQGIVKYFNINVTRRESETNFLSAGKSTKLIVGDEEIISFIGAMGENERTILDVVNKLKKATALQVFEETGISMESVVDILRDLVKKYFIVEYKITSEESVYYSFYNYVIKE